jgi:hypothetical protein
MADNIDNLNDMFKKKNKTFKFKKNKTDKIDKTDKTDIKKADILKKKQKDLLNKKITKIKNNLIKLKKWRNRKTSRYYQNYDNFISDFKIILESNFVTIININQIITSISKYYFLQNIYNKYIDDDMKTYEEQNKNLLEDLKQNNFDAYYDQMFEIEDKIRIESLQKISMIIIDILRLIYNKFNRLSDKIIYDFVSINYRYDIVLIIEYLKQIKFITKNSKLIKILYNTVEIEFFDIIEKIDITDLLSSKYIHIKNYSNIKELVDKYNLNDRKKEICDYLIFILNDKIMCTYDDLKIKYDNIINYLINECNIDIYQKIKILGSLSFTLFYINTILTGFFENEDIVKNYINDYENKINPEYKIYFDKINITEKIEIDKVFEIDDLLQKKILNSYHIFEQTLKYEDDKTYSLFHQKISGYEIKKFIRKIRLIFINSIKDYIKQEKNIEKIYNLNIFKYDNFILDYHEKINLFNNVYSGKITNKDIELFILYHNQIINHILENTIPTENMVKLAFNCCNINFIEFLIDKKYPITTKHLTYILDNNETNIKNILKIINKYNTINFFENFDWYYHIINLCPNIEFSEILFNQNNTEIILEFENKIKELNDNNLIQKLNDLDFIEFIKYVKYSSNKIKLDVKDIMRLNDFNKRWILLN